MSLAPGTRLGPYEIVAQLGAGGMGEVYRAKDTRLGRDVAVKVLPHELSTNPEIRARFEREARTISALNHPNICTLHDVGRHGDTDFLVMELVEGETLAERLTRGPLPLAEVLRAGAQIADALGRAHRAGVMHRDLKPGNVMLTKSGAKLLDFGLARPTGLGPAGGLTHSPTVAGPLTAEGTILGTFQYMAPEQLEGKEADARADLWALGCVLYEMATGKRAFEGATQASLISAIMRDEPRPLADLAPMSPPELERVVRLCLAKDADDRIQTAHDVKLRLQGIGEPISRSSPSLSSGSIPVPAPSRPSRERIAWIAAVIAVVAGAFLWQSFRPQSRPASAPRMRFTVLAPLNTRFDGTSDAVAIAPDGSAVAFLAKDDSGLSYLWIRDLSSFTARMIEGTENASSPFWSPDSRFLGFFSGGKLKKIGIAGGLPQVLCDAPNNRGASWGSGGEIVFAPTTSGGIYRVSSDGGEPVEVLLPDPARKESSLRYPTLLPDGKHFLFVSLPRRGPNLDVQIGSIDSKERVPLMRADAIPRFAEPGYLVTSRNQRLIAQPFDPAERKLIGEPIDVAEAPPAIGPYGVPVVTASRNGILAYSATRLSNTQLIWLDRAGKRQGVVPLPVGRWEAVHLAPDDRHAFVGKPSAVNEGDWWIADLETGSVRKFCAGVIAAPALWSPDGERAALQINKTGPEDLFVKATDGSGPETQLVVSDVLFKNPSQWTPDGRYVLFEQPFPETGWDIYRASPDGNHAAEPVVQTAVNERGGVVSPDGHWLAFESEESGRSELYVQAYPDGGRRTQLTTAGLGTWFGPNLTHWSKDGRELVFFDGKLSAIDVRNGPKLETSAPRPLFSLPVGVVGLAVTSDHQRFVIAEPVKDADPPAIGIDVNWTATLEGAGSTAR